MRGDFGWKTRSMISKGLTKPSIFICAANPWVAFSDSLFTFYFSLSSVSILVVQYVKASHFMIKVRQEE